MNLREALLKEHSKAQTMHIVQYIGSNQARFDALIDLFFHDEYRVNQRAAWALSYAVEAHPHLIQPHFAAVVDNLENPVHDAVKRNTLRVLKDIPIPEELLGKIATICFDLLADPQEAIAIRAFSMELLYQITLREPGLADELRLLIEDHWDHASAGFKSKGRKVLKGLAKLKR